MATFALSLIILLTLVTPHAIAAPGTEVAAPAARIASRSESGPDSGSDATRFSFAAWVDTIVADPETALKPQEAVQAFIASVNATEKSAGHGNGSSTGLGKRMDTTTDHAICWHVWGIHDESVSALVRTSSHTCRTTSHSIRSSPPIRFPGRLPLPLPFS